MVSPISAVRFTANEAPAVNPLEREGAYSKQKTEVPADAPAKKSGKGKKVLKTVGALAAVAAVLVGLNKFGVTKVLESGALKDAKVMQKVGHYVGKAGEFIAKYTIDPLMKLFKSKKAAEVVEEVVEEVAV